MEFDIVMTAILVIMTENFVAIPNTQSHCATSNLLIIIYYPNVIYIVETMSTGLRSYLGSHIGFSRIGMYHMQLKVASEGHCLLTVVSQ